MSTPASPYRRLGTLLCALLLAGCSSAPAVAPPPAPPPWQGTLTLWAAEPPAGLGGREGLARRLQAYMDAHPGVRVELEIKADAGAALAEAAPAARPDLALAGFDPHLWPRGCPARPEGAAAAAADWLPGVAAALAPDGAICGVPLYVQGQVLALNLAAWKAAGVAPPAQGRWSPAEFEAAAAALAMKGVQPLSFFALPGYTEWWPLLLAGGGRLLDPRGRELGLDGAALARVAGWARSGRIDPDAGKLPPEAVYAAFAADPPRLAMLPVPARLLPSFRQPPYLVPELGVAAFPGGANLGSLFGCLLTGDGAPDRQAAALALAEYLADGPAQLAWARQAGGFPAGRRAGNPYPGDPVLTAAYAAMENLEPLPAGAWWRKAEPMLGRHLQLAAIGGETPAGALAAARGAIAPLLRDAGT